MIRRLYVNNFRCLENFELRIAGQSSVLLIGKNGSGKTTFGPALEILKPVYTREIAQVLLAKTGQEQEKEARFRIDWHMVALPIVQEQSSLDPLFIFKRWLARMLILRPIPTSIAGESNQETLEPDLQVTDFGAWFAGLLAYTPAAYGKIDECLKQLLPHLKDIKNRLTGSKKEIPAKLDASEIRFPAGG